jgi:hypothetical protein
VEQVIHLPAHAVEPDHLREVDHRGVEALEPGQGMLVGLDRHEHGDADIDARRVEDGDAPLDDAGLLQLLDAAPAGCGREPDLLADIGHGERAVLLQDLENLDVHLIEHGQCRLEPACGGV